ASRIASAAHRVAACLLPAGLLSTGLLTAGLLAALLLAALLLTALLLAALLTTRLLAVLLSVRLSAALPRLIALLLSASAHLLELLAEALDLPESLLGEFIVLGFLPV